MDGTTDVPNMTAHILFLTKDESDFLASAALIVTAARKDWPGLGVYAAGRNTAALDVLGGDGFLALAQKLATHRESFATGSEAF